MIQLWQNFRYGTDENYNPRWGNEKKQQKINKSLKLLSSFFEVKKNLNPDYDLDMNSAS